MEPGCAARTPGLDFTDLVSGVTNNTIIRYSGSLTTPPCSESVSWIISTKTLPIDEITFQKVKAVIKFNSRYTQNYLGGVNLLQNAADELNCSKKHVGEKKPYTGGENQRILD